MTVTEWLIETHTPVQGFIFRPHVRCKDGFSVSVQASRYHYCTPRETDVDPREYTHVELVPSESDTIIAPYSEGPDSSVYSQVPVSVVDELGEKHGGFA